MRPIECNGETCMLYICFDVVEPALILICTVAPISIRICNELLHGPAFTISKRLVLDGQRVAASLGLVAGLGRFAPRLMGLIITSS